MDFNQYIQHRRDRWRRLAELLDRIEAKGMKDLPLRDTEEFFALYRLVSSDLNLVQTRTSNPAISEYLEGLVARAYAHMAPARRFRPFRALWNIVRHRYPAVVRSEKRLMGAAAAALLLGAVFGFVAALARPSSVEVFLPREHLLESPSDRVARLEEWERRGRSQIETAGEHAVFTTFLFTHNMRVTALGFALGATLGVGTIIILFYNGAILGALAALYLADGVGLFFFAWVGPHGSLELPCVVFGCAAGLLIARAQFRRDAGPVAVQLRALRPRIVDLLVGTGTFLIVAGVIEGGFSQVNEPTLPYWLKSLVAVLLFAGFMLYAFALPVKPTEDTDAQEAG